MKKLIFLTILAAAGVYAYFWYVRDIELVSYLRRVPTGSPVTWSYSDPSIKDRPGPGGWFEAAPLPEPRTELAAAAWDSKIYAIGGLDGFARTMSAVSVFDLKKGTWSEAAPLPLAVNQAAAVAMDGKIYAIGGFLNWGRQTSDALMIYDAASGSWQTGTPMSKALADPEAIAYGGKIHVFGGRNSIGADSVHLIYDPATATWTQGDELNSPRYGLAAAEIGGNVYLLGGRSETLGGELNVFEMFDPKEVIWDTLESMPTRRGGLSAVGFANNIYVFGGQAMTAVFDRVDKYDLAARKWGAAPTMPAPRRDFGLALADNAIFVIGGSPRSNFSVSDRVFVFMPTR